MTGDCEKNLFGDLEIEMFRIGHDKVKMPIRHPHWRCEVLVCVGVHVHMQKII